MSLVNFKQGQLANYKALETKNADTLYFVTDEGLLYLGSKLIAATSIDQKKVDNQAVDGVYTITYFDSTNTKQTIDVATTSKISSMISSAIAGLDTTNDVVVASQSGDVVTLTKAVKETDGIISAVTGDNSTIALGTAAVKNYKTTAISTTGEETSTDLVNASQVAAYVESKMSGVVGAMVYQGTIGAQDSGATITELPTASTSNKGYVYVVKTAGTYASKACEVGDMIISNGTSWDVVNGENQVTNSDAEITLGASSSTTIATVDGTDITIKVKTLEVEDATGTSGNVISGLSTSTAGKLTVTKTNVIASITGESTISGNSSLVAVTATTTNNATTLASEVKTQTLASAANNADGLATAYDVKQNAAANCVLTSYSTVGSDTGNVAATDTINSAIHKLETVISWGTF